MQYRAVYDEDGNEYQIPLRHQKRQTHRNPMSPIITWMVMALISVSIIFGAGVTAYHMVVPPQPYVLVSLDGKPTDKPSSLDVNPPSQPATVNVVPANNTNVNFSQKIARIDQHSGAQYNDTYQFGPWWNSACSAATMAEVINAYYGTNYKVSDILSIEAGVLKGGISTDLGLLRPDAIDETLIWYGFSIQPLQSPSLQHVVDIANAGSPVIVNIPPQTRMPGGHFLLVVGGDGQNVKLVDSSLRNWKTMSYSDFASYWQGFAKVAQPSKYRVTQAPTISPQYINKVLRDAGSPAAGQGQLLWDLGKQYGIDPAYALATYHHESGYGTQGEARATLSLSNMRCIQGYECVDQDRGGYTKFPNFRESFKAFYALIDSTMYVKAFPSRMVPGTIIPRYAPTQDNNDETAYINSLQADMDRFRTESAAMG